MREKEIMPAQKFKLPQEQEIIAQEKIAFAQEMAQEKMAFAQEIVHEQDILNQERVRLAEEKLNLMKEKETIAQEKQNFAQEKETFAQEKETFAQEMAQKKAESDYNHKMAEKTRLRMVEQERSILANLNEQRAEVDRLRVELKAKMSALEEARLVELEIKKPNSHPKPNNET
jgi:hypothetical protein